MNKNEIKILHPKCHVFHQLAPTSPYALFTSTILILKPSAITYWEGHYPWKWTWKPIAGVWMVKVVILPWALWWSKITLNKSGHKLGFTKPLMSNVGSLRHPKPLNKWMWASLNRHAPPQGKHLTPKSCACTTWVSWAWIN